jgi:aldose sugar dehydrogenase
MQIRILVRLFRCDLKIQQLASHLILIAILILGLVSSKYYFFYFDNVYAPNDNDEKREERPEIEDHNLKSRLVVNGLDHPTSMAFLNSDDILVLEKNNGKVKRIINGVMLAEPLLDVNVANKGERGMLGIAISEKQQKTDENNSIHNTTYVFLYFTESKTKKDGSDDCPPPQPYYCKLRNEPLANRLYRYELINNKLVNPKLLLNLPASPGPNHNGGMIALSHDNIIYLTIGDVLPYYDDNYRKSSGTKALNFENSSEPDGRAGILRVTEDGQVVNGKGILGNEDPLNKYYAYGIRNSFGIDFDPITKKLWDTENGPAFGDEINLVEPGFNSGWIQVQGIWKPMKFSDMDDILELKAGDILQSPDHSDNSAGVLVNFGGKGKYSEPEFTWFKPAVGPTAIKFFNSDKYGKNYENDMFVGDLHNGYLYHFDLNKNRTGLLLKGPLADRVANNHKELDEGAIIFGRGFNGISDIEVGPDGYLYIVAIWRGEIYRIIPDSTANDH